MTKKWIPIDSETSLNCDLPMVHHMENGPKYGTFRTIFNQDEAQLVKHFPEIRVYEDEPAIYKYRENYGWEQFYPVQFKMEIIEIKSKYLHMEDDFKIECYMSNTSNWYDSLSALKFVSQDIFAACAPLAAYRIRDAHYPHHNRLVINYNFNKL